ncbi:hypothetical protein [Actinophytocola sp.]|uniref:hypothetical protein n=1 Tax=Actinophytocola sp. TaxID=1872138 RepID=UPI002EDB2764
MTAPTVDTDWLRSNPADAFAHHAPADFARLLEASAGYRLLCEEWLAVHHQDVLPGFTQPEIDVLYRRLADPEHKRTDDGARYDVARWVEGGSADHLPELLDSDGQVFVVSLRALTTDDEPKEVRLRLLVEDVERVRVDAVESA